MSTPLYISNAPAIELRNIMKHLQVGNVAKFEDLEGRIEFVCDDYITICVSKRPNDDPHAKSNEIKCCVIVYRENWGDVLVEPVKQYGKSYSGTTNDHPGNELLPSIEERWLNLPMSQQATKWNVTWKRMKKKGHSSRCTVTMMRDVDALFWEKHLRSTGVTEVEIIPVYSDV